MGRENRRTQREMLEGVKTIKQKENGEESVEYSQPNGPVAVDDLLVSKSMRNEHEHLSKIGFVFSFCF